MLDKLQAMNALLRYTKPIQGHENKRWIVEIEVKTANHSLTKPVGTIAKHIEKPLYKVIDQVNTLNNDKPEMIVDHIQKAKALLCDSFTRVAFSSAVEICEALKDTTLVFNNLDIVVDSVDGEKVIFTFISKGASSSVTPEVFAKNWLVGNITEKAAS